MQMDSLKYLLSNSIYPIAAFVVSLILTRVCIFILPHLGYMDMPKGRHIHKKPVPRAGGIGFIIAFWLAVSLYAMRLPDNALVDILKKAVDGDPARLSFDNVPVKPFLMAMGGASAILFLTGLYDDRFDMPSVIKLLLQIAAGVTLFRMGGGIHKVFGYTLPTWLALVITVCWTIGIVNAFNLIDGLDGLAAGLASISSVCIAFWILLNGIPDNLPMVILLLTFCASCLGFLVFNFSPAKIFMGDTGSMFLGLFFAMTSMNQCAGTDVTIAALLVPLVAIGVPIFDVILAIWRRSVRRFGINMIKENLDNDNTEVAVEIEHGIDSTGRIGIKNAIEGKGGVMDADQDHLHHRLLREAHNKTSRAVLLIYALSIVLSLGAIGLTFIGRSMPALAFLLVIIGVFFTLRLANIELLASMSVLAQGVRIPRKSLLLTAAHPLLDIILVTASAFAVFALFPAEIRGHFTFFLFLILVVPYFLVLIFSGIYRTYWLRASIVQHVFLLKLLLLAACLVFIALNVCVMKGWILTGVPRRMILILFLLHTGFSAAAIMAERFFLHFFESFAIRSYYLKNTPEAKEHGTIIYGGGIGCRMYINNLYSSRRFSCPFRIVGIIDEDLSLHKLNVYGFRVLGSSRDLEDIFAKNAFDTIVLSTANISTDTMIRLEDFAEKHDIRMTMFLAQEYPADKEFFQMLQSKAIHPVGIKEDADDPNKTGSKP